MIRNIVNEDAQASIAEKRVWIIGLIAFLAAPTPPPGRKCLKDHRNNMHKYSEVANQQMQPNALIHGWQ